MPRADLTDKQKAFVHEYIIDLNATQAAIRAGYSKKTAQEQSSRLLSNVMIQNEVSKVMEERSKRTGITADRVLEELAKIGFSNILDYVTVQSNGLAAIDLSEITRDQAAAIAETQVDQIMGSGKEGEPLVAKAKLKLIDKKGALELLGRHLAMFVDKQEHKVSGEITIKVVE